MKQTLIGILSVALICLSTAPLSAQTRGKDEELPALQEEFRDTSGILRVVAE